MTERLIERSTRALKRVALVLAALYSDRLGDATQGEKAECLSRLGFSNDQYRRRPGLVRKLHQCIAGRTS